MFIRLGLVLALFAAHSIALGFETRLSLHRDAVQQVRLGDRIIDSVTLHSPLDSKDDLIGLPQAGSLTDAIVLRSSRVTHRKSEGEDQITIELEYQIFKSVEEKEALTIPAVSLRSSQGNVWLIPEWTLSVVPVLGNETPLEELDIADMAHPPYLQTAPWMKKASQALFILLAIIGLGWMTAALILYRQTPFARCRKQLGKLAKTAPSDARLVEAMKLVHKAFNRSYGRVMFEDHVEAFCIQTPDFRLLKTNLQTFFKCSRDLFYLKQHRYDPEGTFQFLLELADAAAVIEKERK